MVDGPEPCRDVVFLDRPSPGLVVATINRPKSRNALDRAVVRALRAALHDDGARVLVLRSSDPHAFSSGADRRLPDAERALLSDELYALYADIIEAPIPVIAALDGIAVGGGAQIAVAA